MTEFAPEDIVRCAELCVHGYRERPTGFRPVWDLRVGLFDNLLIIPGTRNLKNAIRDARFIPAKTRGGYWAHRGFVSAAEDLYKTVCAMVPQEKRRDLIIGGHSLGGAAALILAETFQCRAVTFGGPRTYSRIGKDPKIAHVRVVAGGDPVPMLLPLLCKHLSEPGVRLPDNDLWPEIEDHSMVRYYQHLQRWQGEGVLCVA